MADPFQYIKLPDGSYGKFRSDATDADIRTAIAKDFPDAFRSSAMPKPNAIGAANQLLSRYGIQVSPMANPASKGLPGIQTPLQTDPVNRQRYASSVDVDPVNQNLTAAMARLLSVGSGGNQPFVGSGKSITQVANERGTGIIGSPKNAYEMVAGPARAIGSGEAGAYGELGAEALKAIALKKANDAFAPAPSQPSVKAVPEAEIYSKPADLVASALRSNARVDMPAEANIAHSAIREAMADKGYTPDMFTGRNGPRLFQDAVQHAIDLAETRKAQVMEPIKGETVDPRIFDANPELAARFRPGEQVTYGRLMSELSDMNKELTRSNFYTKDLSDQVAANDSLAATETAAAQARNVIYKYASKRTGVDLGPMQRQESALIKLQDSANVTANALAAKEAQFNAAPTAAKIGQSIKNLVAIKNNPVSAFFSYEKPGLTSPTKAFNANMRKAFFDVGPTPANTAMSLQDNPVPNPTVARFGFDPNANPSGSFPDVVPAQPARNPLGLDVNANPSGSFPDVVKAAAKRGQFGFDPNQSDVLSSLPDIAKKIISRERANAKGGYARTGNVKPKQKGR